MSESIWDWLHTQGGAIYTGDPPRQIEIDLVSESEFIDLDDSPYIETPAVSDLSGGAEAVPPAPSGMPFGQWLEMSFRDVRI